MYIGNILQGISQFTTEKSSHVRRIHISHTDLDGVSCTALIKLSQAVLNKDTDSPITYIGLDNPSEIHSEITTAAHACLEQGFSREHDMLMFLITDIGSVNPAVFDKLNKEGIPCAYIVLDHHPQKYKVESASDYDLVYTQDREIARNTGYYLISREACATYTLNDIMLRTLHAYRDIYQVGNHVIDGVHWNPNPVRHGDPLTNLEKALSEFATMVDRYDTGKWGNWNTTPENVAIEVKLNLIFNYFDQRGEDFSDKLLAAMLDVTDTTNWFKDWYDIAVSEAAKLQEDYKLFKERLMAVPDHPCITLTGDNWSVNMGLGINCMYYVTETEDDPIIGNFSLFAREYLENSDINLLINVNRVNKTVELRSKDNGVNCTRIATANGGGGHPKVSGFPIKD